MEGKVKVDGPGLGLEKGMGHLYSRIQWTKLNSEHATRKHVCGVIVF